VDRSPAFLAALASAAVPGLDPVSVEALPSTPDQSFDVAFVQDAEHRRWVVRAPRTDVAGAEMDRTVALLGLLGRRLPFAVPSPKGFVALSEGGRAAVYPYLPGHNLDYAELPPGPGIAAELGRAVAALHNTDPAVFEEAGLPSYDADAYRTRRLAELDRAAETGRVPTSLLTRWEKALEDVTLWRFAPTPTHGDLTGDQVLAVFTDESDASTGTVRAMTGWEDAKVADPADDFAALVADARPEAVETVLEAYAHARVERPDPNLLVRARLVAELGLLAALMRGLAQSDVGAVEVLTTQLRRLDDAVHSDQEDDDYRRTSLTPVGIRRRTARPPALVVDEEDEDLPALSPGEHGPDAGGPQSPVGGEAAGEDPTPDRLRVPDEPSGDEAASGSGTAHDAEGDDGDAPVEDASGGDASRRTAGGSTVWEDRGTTEAEDDTGAAEAAGGPTAGDEEPRDHAGGVDAEGNDSVTRDERRPAPG
jgi:macrolide phosphotransferase